MSRDDAAQKKKHGGDHGIFFLCGGLLRGVLLRCRVLSCGLRRGLLSDLLLLLLRVGLLPRVGLLSGPLLGCPLLNGPLLGCPLLGCPLRCMLLGYPLLGCPLLCSLLLGDLLRYRLLRE